jgi:hypothetical protein
MEPLQQVPDPAHAAHLEAARRVLALPVEASGLHWHPFGVYAAPLARRTDPDGRVWSRRLHLWHPDARPVGPASPYGVHTHTGDAASHVLVGRLQHHLYRFRDDPDGTWKRAELGEVRGNASLVAHLEGTTPAGTVHRFPAHHPHGVGKCADFAVSLFEQAETARATPFTTWQRLDMEAEPLEKVGPLSVGDALREARQWVDEALYALRV